jgi:hypothetical protein
MSEAAFEEPRELRARYPELIATRAAQRWKAALDLPGVRGLVIGRAPLYPHDGDVAAAVDAACALVHDVTVRP